MVQPIDVRQVLSSLEYLGQSRARLADIERREKEKKAGVGAQLGGIAGGIIGSYYGGPWGGAAGGAAGSAIGARIAGGDADTGQVVQSGYQGYQMGQDTQKSQNNKKFNTALAENIENDPKATEQQKQYAKYIKESNQDPVVSMQQGQYLQVDPQTLNQQSIYKNINTRTLDTGINELKSRQSGIEDKESIEYKNIQNRIERLENLKSNEKLGAIPTATLETLARREVGTKNETYEDRGKLLYKQTDPFTNETKIQSFGDIEKADKGSLPSQTLKIATESAIDVIINKLGGYPAITPEAHKDIAMLERLSNLPSKNEEQAQKQITAIRKKYDDPEAETKDVKDYWAVDEKGGTKFLGNMPRREALEKLSEGYVLRTSDPEKEKREKTQKERLFDYMETVTEKARAGIPISENEFSRYKQAWLETMVTTDTADAAGNKRLIREGGFLTPEALRKGVSQQPQSDSGAVLASDADQQSTGKMSPITAAQAGEPISTPYTETVQVGEKTWQKTTLNDYDAVKFLGDYNNALNSMESNVGNVAWANYFAAVPKGEGIADILISKLGVGGEGAQNFLVAQKSSKVSMQGFIKGNPSDADMLISIEANAQLTNDPEYNKKIIQYNQKQVQSALKLKLEMMVADKKRLTPQMEDIARKAGIDVNEIYKSFNKSSREVYDSNMNKIKRDYSQFASESGNKYNPKYSVSLGEGNEKQTYFTRPAEYLVSTDNKLFDGVKYTPRMVAEIKKDSEVYNKLSKEEKIKLANSLNG